MSDLERILSKWDDTKKKLQILESRISKYRSKVSKEMNSRGVDEISSGNYTVTRRRNTRAYITKENLPGDIWEKYSTRCSYDVFFIKSK
jgi:hypothetical protein